MAALLYADDSMLYRPIHTLDDYDQLSQTGAAYSRCGQTYDK